VGKIEFTGEIQVISGEPLAYRNRVQLHIEDGAIGYYEHGSHSLCPIEHCAIAAPALNAAIQKLSDQLPRVTTRVELFTNGVETQVSVLDSLPDLVRPLFDSLGTREPIEYDGFRVSRNSFFQVNRFLMNDLVNCAVEQGTGDSAVDLYAGVGLFSVRLAGRFKQVIAVESNRGAFRDLEYNIERRGLPIRAENQTAERFLAGLDQTPELILADPPRTGLGQDVVRELARIRAPQLTIVSCDPATLARDLHGLLSWGYRIERMTLVDLFPETFHLESVTQLISSD
jgi:23S rRNA (uracil1939-C5)-methyltransferase